MSSLLCEVLCIEINFPVLWSIHFFLPLSILRMDQSILLEVLVKCLFFWCDFCCRTWFRGALLFFKYSFIYSFIPVCFMVFPSRILKYMQFLSLQSVLMLSWSCSNITSIFSFIIFYYQHDAFFDVIFYSNILAVFTYSLDKDFFHFPHISSMYMECSFFPMTS